MSELITRRGRKPGRPLMRSRARLAFIRTAGCSCESVLRVKVKVKSLSPVRLFATPWTCDPVDCSPPGSSVHGILQARVLEWAAISFSRGSSLSRDRNQVSCIAGRHFTLLATREALSAVQFNRHIEQPPVLSPAVCTGNMKMNLGIVLL